MRLLMDEMMLIMIYNPGTREGLIDELRKMRMQLGEQEWELAHLANSTIAKLEKMSDAEFEELPLAPDIH